MKEQVQLHPVVVVEGTKLEKVEYQGNLVLSLPMIDRVHQQADGKAHTNFKRNRDRNRFILGKDFFILPHEEWEPLSRSLRPVQRGVKTGSKGGYRGEMIFLTFSGYLMLAKTFTDDLSWRIQRALVDHYFESAKTVAELKDELLDIYRKYVAVISRKANKISDKEVMQMVELKQQGLQTASIAQEIARSRSSVRKHIRDARQLGLFDLAPGQGWLLPEVR